MHATCNNILTFSHLTFVIGICVLTNHEYVFIDANSLNWQKGYLTDASEETCYLDFKEENISEL
jgi:hypothetical protein